MPMTAATAAEILGAEWVLSPRQVSRYRTRRQVIGLVTTAFTFVAVGAWALFLRPQILGGPTTYVLVSGTSMEPTLHDGDIVVVRRQETYRIGQIVAFRVPKGEVGAGAMVIHRITGGSAFGGYKVEGDNRETPDLWHPHPTDIVGGKWLRIPGGGRVFIFLRSPLGVATVAGVLAFLVMVTAPPNGKRKQASSDLRIPAPLLARPKRRRDDRDATPPQAEHHRHPPSPVRSLPDELRAAEIPIVVPERPAPPVDAHRPETPSSLRRTHAVDQRGLPSSYRGGVHSSDHRRLGSPSDPGRFLPGREGPPSSRGRPVRRADPGGRSSRVADGCRARAGRLESVAAPKTRERIGEPDPGTPKLTLLDGVDQAFWEARARTTERSGPVQR